MARNGLNVVFSFSKPAGSPSTTVIAITTTNSTPTPFTNYILQAAVPKVPLYTHTHTHTPLQSTFHTNGRLFFCFCFCFCFCFSAQQYITLNIESPSASVVPPNSVGKVTQNLKLENSLHGQANYPPLTARLKSFTTTSLYILICIYLTFFS